MHKEFKLLIKREGKVKPTVIVDPFLACSVAYNCIFKSEFLLCIKGPKLFNSTQIWRGHQTQSYHQYLSASLSLSLFLSLSFSIYLSLSLSLLLFLSLSLSLSIYLSIYRSLSLLLLRWQLEISV